MTAYDYFATTSPETADITPRYGIFLRHRIIAPEYAAWGGWYDTWGVTNPHGETGFLFGPRDGGRDRAIACALAQEAQFAPEPALREEARARLASDPRWAGVPLDELDHSSIVA